MALKCHPDKGGSKKAMQELNESWLRLESHIRSASDERAVDRALAKAKQEAERREEAERRREEAERILGEAREDAARLRRAVEDELHTAFVCAEEDRERTRKDGFFVDRERCRHEFLKYGNVKIVIPMVRRTHEWRSSLLLRFGVGEARREIVLFDPFPVPVPDPLPVHHAQIKTNFPLGGPWKVVRSIWTPSVWTSTPILEAVVLVSNKVERHEGIASYLAYISALSEDFVRRKGECKSRLRHARAAVYRATGVGLQRLASGATPPWKSSTFSFHADILRADAEAHLAAAGRETAAAVHPPPIVADWAFATDFVLAEERLRFLLIKQESYVMVHNTIPVVHHGDVDEPFAPCAHRCNRCT